MSGITKLKEKMKKQISFTEFHAGEEQKVEKRARKIYTLSKEDNGKLNKIYSNRLSLKGQLSVGNLMSEAINLLYSKEFSDRGV